MLLPSQPDSNPLAPGGPPSRFRVGRSPPPSPTKARKNFGVLPCFWRPFAHETPDAPIPMKHPILLFLASAILSPAASTPCTDGERVYVQFGAFGLLA